MRDVGNKVLLERIKLVQLPRHRVEIIGELRELVLSFDLNPVRKLSGGDGLRGFRKPPERTGDRAHDPEGNGQAHEQRGKRHA